MERLTFEGNFCDIAQCRDTACKQSGTCTQRLVWERLKAYEDAGLSPQACSMCREIEEGLSSTDYSISRMLELMKADKEGRVVVLPCKAGTPVWRISRTFATYPDKSEQYVRNDTFFLSDLLAFGKTVFLTREEAEKALREIQGKEDADGTTD